MADSPTQPNKLSFEEAFPDASKKPSTSSGNVSFEEAFPNAPQPGSKRKLLDIDPEGGALANVGRFVGTGTIKALSHLPGFFGDLEELAHMAAPVPEWAARKLPGIKEKSYSNILASYKNAKDAKNDIFNVPGPPSGQDIQNKILPYTGEYKPPSGAGRTGMAFLEAATPGVSGPTQFVKTGLAKAAEALKNYGTRTAIPQGMAGATGQVVGEQTGNPALAMAAAIAAGKFGAVVPRAVEARVFPKDMSERIAGSSLRESATDPNSVQQQLQSQPSLFPNMTPTSAQLSRDPGIAAMESSLEQSGKSYSSTSSPEAIAARSTTAAKEQNAAAFGEGVNDVVETLNPNMQQNYGVGSGSRQSSSTAARTVFTDLEKAADDAVKSKWLAIPNFNVYTKKVVEPLLDYIGKLSPTRQRGLPADEIADLNKYIEDGTSQIPLQYLQDIRSKLLETARDNPGTMIQFENNEIARQISKLIGDEKNVVFGDATGAQRTSYFEAVGETKNYHDTYDVGVLKELNKESRGAAKIATDATLGKVLNSKNASQNLEQLRKATNNAIDPNVSDYLVSKLTQDGTKLVSPKDVEKFIADNHSVLKLIPDARVRLEQIQAMAEQHAIATQLAKHAGNPTKLLGVLSDNKDAINRIKLSNPDLAQKLEQLENSAFYMEQISPTGAANLGILNKLESGKTSTILHGKSIVPLSGTLSALGLARAAQSGIPLSELASYLYMTTPIIGPAAIPAVRETFLSGKVPQVTQQVLQTARANPKEMRRLMNLPELAQSPRIVTGYPALTGAMGTAAGVERAEGQSTGGRIGRASGGRAVNHADMAEKLVRQAERVKKVQGQGTEALLDHQDDAIISALEIANRHI